MFSIYEVLPEILQLWGTNQIMDAESKKHERTEREITTLFSCSAAWRSG